MTTRRETRTDTTGVVWNVCDPYPTYFRWENGELITPDSEPDWEDA